MSCITSRYSHLFIFLTLFSHSILSFIIVHSVLRTYSTHFIQFLILRKKYPKTLFKLEGGLKLNSLQKRTDILIFNKEGKADILVECKATTVKIDQKVFDQAARYNMIHQVNYLLVTNGLEHYCCKMDYEQQTYSFIEELPIYLAK